MTKPKKYISWEEEVKIIARMVYRINGSDANQPKMVGLKEAVGTFDEFVSILLSDQKKEIIKDIKKWTKGRNVTKDSLRSFLNNYDTK